MRQQGIFARLGAPVIMINLNFRCLLLLALGQMGANLPVMANSNDVPTPSTTASIVLGGGCFWCVEALYERVEGVSAVVSGYAGGHTANPTYQQIGRGDTGHAEVVQIQYDPAVVSLDKLLEFFWVAHDPTTLNRQGADVGPQYRSIILPANEAEMAAANASLKAAQSGFTDPIVTEIKLLERFYKAEGYHQDYFNNNPDAPYCRYVIAPKLKKLEQ